MSDKKKHKAKEDGLGEAEDYARQIWLAGLGAYTRLGKEGSKLFDALIRDGEDAEKLAGRGSLDKARSKVEKARRKLADKLDGWEERVDKSLLGATERLGLVRQAELQALEKRIDELSAAVAKLSAVPATKPVRKASTSKVAEAKPKAAAATTRTTAKAAAKPAAKTAPKATGSTASRATTDRKPASKASSTTPAAKTAPRRRSTTPKASTRGKTTPAPATDATPGTPPEL